ncbi:MAG: PfkB family carbohydrate kinase [Erysipelotrichaceae bacterium]|nr:PfkB family carbohydrate kinase [Erysipelotrichaceae bacterium]
MGIVVMGAVFVDVKGYPFSKYIPEGRNAGNVEIVHGGVSRNVVEDIANVELRPTFLSLVDDTGNGIEVIDKLKRHKVDTSYMRTVKDGMGTWLAIFDTNGDVRGSISKRPDLMPIYDILCEQGDEIISKADSIVLEFDIDVITVKKTIELAKKYNKKIFAVISNMSIAVARRDLLEDIDCIVCNKQEAGILFSEDYESLNEEEMEEVLVKKINGANIKQMVVTLGEKGAVYATLDGDRGYCPAWQVDVVDTTGAGDAFFSGVTIGLTYGKTMAEACNIGARLAASVICTKDNVCPRFKPSEFGIEVNND